MSFYYVYSLQSESDSARFHVGLTEDLKARLAKHNSGGIPHTVKSCLVRTKTAIAFTEEPQAHDFESDLKTASGRAFARKRR